MSPLRPHDDLDELEREILRLGDDLVAAQRKAGDLLGDEFACQLAEAEGLMAKIRIDHKLRLYFRLSREARRARCSVHGDAAYALCPECREAFLLRRPDNVVPLSTSLQQSNDVTALANELGVEPAKALKIARAALKMRRVG